ncbi:MAG TPA: hypothetical protein VJ732_13700, partial [Bryobacteraceae bacterium]|nr:hypothetical protein [Bryobacteraceae bacterium]
DSALDPGLAEENPYVFADTGIPLLLRQIMGSGGIQNRLILCAAGAANVVDPMRTFDIGKRNYLAMRRLLWKAGVFLHAEAVGGAASRSLHLEIGAGKLWLNEAGEQRELAAWNSRKGAPLWPTVF